ncbi:MAG: hypothetical protein Q8Q04_00805 [archaeon]|nr:hypothetical protein [archaeon]
MGDDVKGNLAKYLVYTSDSEVGEGLVKLIKRQNNSGENLERWLCRIIPENLKEIAMEPDPDIKKLKEAVYFYLKGKMDGERYKKDYQNELSENVHYKAGFMEAQRRKRINFLSFMFSED